MTTTTLDPAAIARKLNPAVNAVLLAQARAELLREKVDAIKARLLSARDYYSRWKDDPRHKDKAHQEPIRDPNRDYWLTDDDAAIYHDDLREAVAADPTIPKPSKPEYCPALEAETLLVQCQNTLLDVAAELIPDIAAVRHAIYGDNRKKMLDLLIGMAVNAPGYRRASILV